MELSAEKMEKLKAVELELLKQFIDICEKLGLKYYLYGGTLLGAVRHKGFIPWDDDIDVAMLRPDFDIFVREAPKYLPEGLFLQTHESDPQYLFDYAKIRNSNTAFIETLSKDLRMNHGIFLDIFPLDYCTGKNSRYYDFEKRVLRQRLWHEMFHNESGLYAKLATVYAKLRYPTAEAAYQARKKLFEAVKEGDCVAHRGNVREYAAVMPVEWYGEGVMVEFEGVPVRAPKEYDKYLTHYYGDYRTLPPKEKQVSCHNTEVIDTERSYLEYVDWA